jgi:hypothetical protein
VVVVVEAVAAINKYTSIEGSPYIAKQVFL